MARYPKPAGWNGGPDGSIQRQGSGGRLGLNLATELGDSSSSLDRMNILDFDEADFGGSHGGQCDDHYEVNEYGDA